NLTPAHRTRRSHAQEQVHGGAEGRCGQGGGGRRERARAVPPARHEPRDPVCLEAEVRRHGGFGREAAQAARGREPPAEADRRRPGPHPPGAERCPGKQVVAAWARRQGVGKLRAAYPISERRALRFTGFARSSVRYRSVREPQDALRAAIREIAGEKPRWGSLPLQDTARSWLAELRATKRGPARPEHCLLRTHPDRDALPNKDVYARRMARVQALAGLKLEGERSHVFRRTHASWAHANGIPPHEIKLFLGHSGVFGGATDDYIEMI